MATTLSDPEVETGTPENSSEPTPFVLTDRFPHWARMSRSAALLVIVLALCCWRLSSRPLYHTDLWGHLSYGKLIVETGRLPATEPFLPLAQGVPVVDTAWLSQVLGYGIQRLWGLAGLQMAFGFSIVAVLACLARALYLRSYRLGTALLGIFVCCVANAQQWVVGWDVMPALIRPQLAGVICYAWLFCHLSRQQPHRSDWYTIPLVTMLWANLHGSFVMGPLLLAVWGVGRAVDTWRHTGSVRLAVLSRQAWHWLLIAELSAAAALLNPYGLGLYLEVFNFSHNPNLQDLLDWDPLSLTQTQGKLAAYVTLALIVVYRLSPRRVTTAETVLLMGLGIWAWTTSRMLTWWAIPAGFYLALHWRAWRRMRAREAVVPTAPERHGLWTVVTIGICWVAFGLTPFGVKVLHKRDPELKRAVANTTPVGAVEYLHKKPPQGQVFNTYEWGDYLGWAGPPGMKLFVNSHPHLIPQEIWRHYMSVSRAFADWDDVLDRYSVNCVVLNSDVHIGLTSQLRNDERWQLVYEDGLATIFKRKKPL